MGDERRLGSVRRIDQSDCILPEVVVGQSGHVCADIVSTDVEVVSSQASVPVWVPAMQQMGTLLLLNFLLEPKKNLT